MVRLFNPYGPRMHTRDGRVVSNFLVSAIKNQPLTVYGDDEEYRSFCYTDNLVKGLLAMMQAPAEVIGPVNLGNPAECTIGKLAQKVIVMTGTNCSLEHLQFPTDDTIRRQHVNTCARRILGWEPSIAD